MQLSLRNNGLSGELRLNLAGMSMLQVLDLSHNKLSGPLSSGLFDHPAGKNVPGCLLFKRKIPIMFSEYLLHCLDQDDHLPPHRLLPKAHHHLHSTLADRLQEDAWHLLIHCRKAHETCFYLLCTKHVAIVHTMRTDDETLGKTSH
jgi:hypothetical protein